HRRSAVELPQYFSEPSRTQIWSSRSRGDTSSGQLRNKAETLTDIWHQAPNEIADWMRAADPEKAGKVCMALGEGLGLFDQRRKEQGYTRIEDQGHWNEAEARYNLPIDKGAGWNTWYGKLAWLDDLSFEDKLREGPALLGNFFNWVDQ